MEGAMRHIDRYYPDGNFSEVYIAQSIVTLGNTTLNISFSDRGGCRAIYVHGIYMTVVATAAATVVILRDQFSQEILTQSIDSYVSFYAPLNLVRKGSQFGLRSQLTNLSYSIAYQYIM